MMDSRSLLTRAQYMKGVAATSPNEDATTQDDDNQASVTFKNKYGFIFAPPSTLDTNCKNQEKGDHTHSTPIELVATTDSNGKPINRENPLDRFRRAGMKARLVQRVGKFVEERLTTKQIFNRYVKASTLHGFRFIFTKTFYVRRFIWLVLTLAMAISFLKELHDSIKLYNNYPFSTTSTTDYVNELQFPAVTICNLNKFRASQLKKTKLGKLALNNTTPMEMLWQDPGFDIPGDQLRNIMDETSHHISDMLLQCVWIPRDAAEGRPNVCQSQNFSIHHNLYGQQCFTLNSGKRGHPLLKLNETGLTHSLEIHLNLSTHDYLPETKESGVRVIIHEPTESPLLANGFVVSPGFHTFVELIPEQIVNLPPPFETRCGKTSLKYFSTYQRSNCFEEELIDMIISKCSCRGAFMPSDPKFPLCSLRETQTCLYPAIARFSQKSARSCPIDCQSTMYKSQISYGRFMSSPPTGHQAAEYLYNLQVLSGMSDKELSEYYRDNIVVLTFFYQDLKVHKIEQEKTYDFWKLIGDVGGQLGLMLGASVLTLVEFIDLICFMIYHQLLRLSKRHKKQKENKNTKMSEKHL